MYIAGRDHRLVKQLSELYNPPVKLHQILHGLHRFPVTANHKRIIPQRLDFQIIIKTDNL